MYLVVRVLMANLLVRSSAPALPFSQLIELVLFILTAAMIVVARRFPREYGIDRLTLVFFLLFGTLFRVPASASDGSALDPLYYFFFPVALVLALLIIRSRGADDRWARLHWGWMGLGLLAGIAPVLLVEAARALVFGDPGSMRTIMPVSAGGFMFMFMYWMGHSAILEEPTFRGFLWWHLGKLGWRGRRIWLLQAGLFWLAHLRYVDRPFTFWLTVPASGLIFGWLAWKSRCVGPALVAHAAYNALAAFA